MVVPAYQRILVGPGELPSEVQVVHPCVREAPQLKYNHKSAEETKLKQTAKQA